MVRKVQLVRYILLSNFTSKILFKMDVKFEYRVLTAQNFRQLIHVKNIEICEVIKNVENFMPFAPYLMWFNETLKGNVHKCPYKEFLAVNSTYATVTDMRTLHGVQTFDLPDGIIRCKWNSNPFSIIAIFDYLQFSQYENSWCNRLQYLSSCRTYWKERRRNRWRFLNTTKLVQKINDLEFDNSNEISMITVQRCIFSMNKMTRNTSIIF